MLTFNVRESTTIMSARRWDLVVAGVELACGIGVAAYFVVLGLTADGAPDRSGLDRAFPFLLAALGLAVLGTMAWRSVRRARTSPAFPGHDRGGFPDVERQRGPHAGTPRAPTPPAESRRVSEQGGGAGRIVGCSGAPGSSRPASRPRGPAESVADAGEPVTAGTCSAPPGGRVLAPRLDTDDHLAALAFHEATASSSPTVPARSTTSPASWRRADRPPRAPRDRRAPPPPPPPRRRRPGPRLPGRAKYLSTVLHVAVARAAHAQGRRLAWLWVDQGVWITALRGGTTVEALNAELAGGEPWEWVDEQAPTAAGEP